MKDKKDIIIILLVVIIVLLFVFLYKDNQYKNTVTHNNAVSSKTHAQIKIPKNVSFPNQSPLTVMKYIITNYNTCISNSVCPLSSSFRKTAEKYIKNKGVLNPITRIKGTFINPVYSIITELPTISIIKVTNSNGTNATEYDLKNINNKWALTNSYCFNSPQSQITATAIAACS
jgi:hypothetical protein